MKRYILFAFDRYYPSGGMNDRKDSFDTLEEVDFDKSYNDYDNYQLLDTNTGEVAGISMRLKIEEYEEKNGDIEWHKDDEVRSQLFMEWIREVISN